MKINIDGNLFDLDWESNFSERVSDLKKKNKIDIKLSIFIRDTEIRESQNRRNLKYLQEIKDLPKSIYISKSDFYHWVFKDCKLISKSFRSIKGSSAPWLGGMDRHTITLTISYNDVFGTNVKSVAERDIKLGILGF